LKSRPEINLDRVTAIVYKGSTADKKFFLYPVNDRRRRPEALRASGIGK
jgi:hypothetical protein